MILFHCCCNRHNSSCSRFSAVLHHALFVHPRLIPPRSAYRIPEPPLRTAHQYHPAEPLSRPPHSELLHTDTAVRLINPDHPPPTPPPSLHLSRSSMVKGLGGLDDEVLLEADVARASGGSFLDVEKQDTTNDDNSDDPEPGEDEKTAVTTVDELLSEVESCKGRGNVGFHKGRVMAKHTAGKNLLRDACIAYAEGLQALAKADARLLAEQSGHQQQDGGHDDNDEQQQQHQREEEGEQRPENRDDSAVDNSSGSSGSGSSGSSRFSLSQLAALSERADAVRPFLYLNLAACNLLLQEWAPAIACCTHVLDECCGDALLAAEEGTDGDGVEAAAAAATAAGGNVGRRTNGGSTAASAADMPSPDREQQLHHHEEREQENRVPDGEDKGSNSSSSSSSRLISEGEVAAEVRGPKQREGEEQEQRKRQAETSRRREIAAKCLYRRAAARAGGGDLDAAREDLVRALRLKPRDAAIGRELRNVEKKLADEEAKKSLRRWVKTSSRKGLAKETRRDVMELFVVQRLCRWTNSIVVGKK